MNCPLCGREVYFPRVLTPHGPGEIVGPAPAGWPAGSVRVRLDHDRERNTGGYERSYLASAVSSPMALAPEVPR